MAARRLWILLLLAAVFSMHSVAPGSADPGAAEAPTTTASHDMDASASASVTLATSVASHLPLPDRSPSSAVAAGDQSPPDAPVHEVATHFLSVCLAVLLAGLVWLFATVTSRRVAALVVIYPATRPRLDMGWFRPPRPPDLSALCLLRI